MENKKRKRGPHDLEHELGKQIGFLISSSSAFDNGYHDEAVRLATALRVLLHDTTNSRSLLGQLGRKNIQFLDTGEPYSSRNLLTTYRLTYMRIDSSGAQYRPLLDDFPRKRFVGFDEWWDAIVICGRDKRCLSRGDIVLIAANQDGGAHVDPAIDASYADIAKDHNTGWEFIGENISPRSIPFAMQVSLRQIAHEVLRSLNVPDHRYSIKPTSLSPETSFAGVSLSIDQPATPIQKKPKVGRNAPCPCGSGTKYKKCCGKP